LRNASCLTDKQQHLSQSAIRLQQLAASVDICHESVTDAIHAISLVKPEPMEVGPDDKLSIHSSMQENSRRLELDFAPNVAVEELNATMNHTIDIKQYPFPSEPDVDLLNASIMVDPSNPFDKDMIARMLSKLAQPLSSYEGYYSVSDKMPKICARGSFQLGRFVL